MQEKVVQSNSQVKLKKSELKDHHRISSFSNNTKSLTACNDSLKSRTSNAKVVCVTCGKCMFNSNHDACVSKYINDMNARTKKPKVVPISTRKPIKNVNQSVATPHKITVASEITIQKSSSYFRMLYEKISKTRTLWIEKQCPLGYIWKPKVNNDNTLTSDRSPLDIKSRGTEFLNKTLQTYFKEEGISHQMTIAQTPKQNDVVERRNRTLVEAARSMLLASKLPLLFWDEAIAINREPLLEEILGVTIQRAIKEILGDTIQRDIEEILRDTTQRDIEEILGDTTQRDIEEILGDTTQRDIEEILGDTTQRDIEEILGDTTQRDIFMYLGNNISG
ncbi:putative ribonuclease H-like domain-containing protein [Tanacetum coccineum]